MVVIRSAALTLGLLLGIALAAPLEAQTSASLNVSARVVEECTVGSKRELYKLARKLNDASVLTRCSIGVVSRVDQRVVKIPRPQPSSAAPTRVSSRRLVKSSISSSSIDVVLVTVTY